MAAAAVAAGPCCAARQSLLPGGSRRAAAAGSQADSQRVVLRGAQLPTWRIAHNRRVPYSAEAEGSTAKRGGPGGRSGPVAVAAAAAAADAGCAPWSARLVTPVAAFFANDFRRRVAVTVLVLACIRWASMATFSWLPDGGVAGLQLARRLNIFDVGIAPTIWGSIFMQMVAFPPFAAHQFVPFFPDFTKLRKEGGPAFQSELQLWTRGTSVLISALMAWHTMFSVLPPPHADGFLAALSAWTAHALSESVVAGGLFLMAGSAIMLYLGDFITASGLGNGVSVIIAFNVIGSFLRGLSAMSPWQVLAGLESPAFWAVAAVAFALLTAAVRAMDAVCRVPIAFFRTEAPRGAAAERDTGLASTMEYIPFRPLEQGTFPIIVALDVTLSVPALLASTGWGPLVWLPVLLSPALPPMGNNWLAPLLFYAVFATVVFKWSTQDSDRMMPQEINSYLMKIGARVPGIQPGTMTVEYLSEVHQRTRRRGAWALTALAVLSTMLDELLITCGLKVAFWPMLLVVGAFLQMRRQASALRQMPKLEAVLKQNLEL